MWEQGPPENLGQFLAVARPHSGLTTLIRVRRFLRHSAFRYQITLVRDGFQAIAINVPGFELDDAPTPGGAGRVDLTMRDKKERYLPPISPRMPYLVPCQEHAVPARGCAFHLDAELSVTAKTKQVERLSRGYVPDVRPDAGVVLKRKTHRMKFNRFAVFGGSDKSLPPCAIAGPNYGLDRECLNRACLNRRDDTNISRNRLDASGSTDLLAKLQARTRLKVLFSGKDHITLGIQEGSRKPR
jgi:hypothetical protein